MAKRATLADVAALAGMSPTAVSLVLNERPGSRLSSDAVQRIKDAAAELHYRPNPAARSLRLGKTQAVGFLSDNVSVTRYASAMIRGLLDEADARNHTLLITETGRSASRLSAALDTMLDRSPDGLVFGLERAREVDLPPLPPGVPVVIVNGTSGEFASVLPDESTSGYEVTRFLTDAGHRRIGLIGFDEGLSSDPRKSATLGARYAGIRRALAEAGAEVVAQYDASEWEPDVGYEAVRRFLRMGAPFTGLVCLNDRLAFGAYQALAAYGRRIPDDVSVVSFDNEQITPYLRPGLTTVEIPYLEMGRRAMELVLGAEAPTGRHLIGMPLRERGSVRPIS